MEKVLSQKQALYIGLVRIGGLNMMKKIIYLLIILSLSGCSNKLWFDERGNAHGSGSRKYYYDSGQVKSIDKYENGQLKNSVWYDKNGNIIHHTKWENGNGIGLYMHENGKIKRIMFYKNTIANGKAIDFDQNGRLIKIREFENGHEVPATSE